MSEETKGTLEEFGKWLAEHPEPDAGEAKRRELWQNQYAQRREEYVKGEKPIFTALEREETGEKFAGYPQGELETTKLSPEVLPEALDFIKNIKPQLQDWINANKLSSVKGATLDSEIKDLQGRLEADQGMSKEDRELLPHVVEQLNKLKKYEFDGAVEIYGLIDEIDNKVRIFSKKLAQKV